MAAAYSLAEVQKHNVPGDLWMVVHDKVYDLSTFAEEVSRE
jgi:cytochrome b involved in lipid metabolism